MSRNISIVLISLLQITIATEAHAIIDPCYTYERVVVKAEKGVNSAANYLTRQVNTLQSKQDQADYRLAALQANIGAAKAQQTSAGYYVAGNTVGCIVNSFFNYGGCRGGGIKSSFNTYGNSQAAIERAQASYAAYAQASAMAIQRQQLRVLAAQDQYDEKVAIYEDAVADLEQCRRDPGSVNVTTTITGNTVVTSIGTSRGGTVTSTGTVR